MKRTVSLIGMLMAVLAFGSSALATLVAVESFDYDPATQLDVGANGGTGWNGSWQAGVGAGLNMDSTDQSLWYGQAPWNSVDGTGAIASPGSESSYRNWSNEVSGTWYFTALVRLSSPDATARFEFFSEPDAAGYMRMNVGLEDYNSDGVSDLFIDATEGVYPATPGGIHTNVNSGVNYLLVAMRTASGVYAALLPGDGTAPSELPIWQVSEPGITGVTFDSLRISVSSGWLRIDELRIATSWQEAIGLELPGPPSTYPPSNKKVYVLLLGGQSNAEGWGYHQYLLDTSHPLAVPQDDVEMYSGRGMPSIFNRLLPLQSGTGMDYNPSGVMQYPALTNEPISRLGPELSMARVVRDGINIPDSKVVVIKHAHGGSTLYGHWKADGSADSAADGSIYKAFQQTVNAGISTIQTKYPYHEVEVIGMGWVQGESDALNADGAYASAYSNNLTTFIADVRATYGTNMVFALSRLSTNQSDNAYWPTIRAAQAAVAAADPRVVATETDGTNYLGATGFAEGTIHYLSSALLQIGEDLGHALVSTVALDADSDQLPDDWENGFMPPGAAGLGNSPTDDYDGDGISDRGEFRLGTSPVDPADGLSLSITNAAAIQWSAKRGISYNVQHSTNLTSWTPVDTVQLESNGLADISVSSTTTNACGFFRIELKP